MALGIRRSTITANCGGVAGVVLHYNKLLSGMRPWGGAAEIKDAALLEKAKAIPAGTPITVTVATDRDAPGLPKWVEAVEVVAATETQAA